MPMSHPSRFDRLSILTLILFLGAFSPLLGQTPVEETILYFPDVIHSNAQQTGIALANQSGAGVASQGEAANVTLFFIDDSGEVVSGPNIMNPAVRNIGPGEQFADLLPDIFGNGIVGKPGLVVVRSSNVAVVGFFLTFDPAVGMIDGADALVSPITRTGNSYSFQGGLSSNIIFQEVLTGAGSTNKVVVLALTGSSPRNGTLELIRNGSVVESQPINFPASDFLISRFVGTLEEIFDTPLQAADYVRATSSRGLTGFQSFGRNKFTAGRNAVRQPFTNRRDNAIFGAQLALTPAINTFLKVVNPTNNSMDLTIQAFPTGPGAAAAGAEPAAAASTREVTLPARSAIREDLSSFLDLSNFTGWLRIDSNRTGLLANASFGDQGGNFFSSVELQASPQRKLVSSHVANGFGFGTGLTFLNPFPDETDVQIDVFDTEGTRTGGGNFVLSSFEHKPILVSQIDPTLANQVDGFILVSASRGIFSFELFFFVPPGTGSVASMSAVPPQRGNGFVEGELTPVVPESSSKRATGGPLRLEYRASASRGVRLDPAWDFRPGEIIVKMKDSVVATQANAFDSLGLHVHREAPEHVMLLRADQIETPSPGRLAALASTPRLLGMKLATLDLIERLNSRPDVEYAQPNYIVQALGASTPNDPLYDLQWHYPFISLDLAWQITTGNPNLVVGVIDTGAKFGHPDLASRLTGGQFDFIDDPQIAADGDGIDGSAEDPGDDPVNPTFHGTHVAGTIGAVTNNGVGVAGGNWQSKLMTLRALGVGGGTTFDVVQAARYAARLSNTSGMLPSVKASVINLSLGGKRSCSPFEMTNYGQVMGQGVVMVVAAGNSNTAEEYAPASCPGVINVGAIGPNGEKAPYSNFGPRITGVAPGGNQASSFFDGVLSTMWDAGGNAPVFDYKQGTSMATPHVSAIVSLMLSINSELSPAQVKQILEETAIDIGAPGPDDIFGAGRFDAFKAVAAAAGSDLVDPILAVDTTLLDFSNSLDSLPLTLTNIGGGTLNISSIDPQTDSGGPWLSVDLSPASSLAPAGGNSATIAVLVDRTGLADGEYTGAVVINSDGGTISVAVRMVVGAETILDVGELIVLAIDPRTLQTAAGVATDVDAGYTYRFQVQAGEYNILAATDEDNDNIICEEDDLCGWFPVDSDPSELLVQAGQTETGVDFLVRPRSGFTLGSSPFPEGFQVPQWLRQKFMVTVEPAPGAPR